MRRSSLATALTITMALGLVACGDDDDAGGDSTAPPAATGAEGTTAATVPTPAVVEEAAACAEGTTLTEGQLTVATGEPAFPPYVIDDTPENGEGFESAVAYAVAAVMGFEPEQVTWTRTPFEAAIQPGPKDFDFNLQQYSISPEREQVVSFSDPYYSANQAILGYADSPAASAESISDYQALRIGVAAGTTSLTFVTDVLQPTSEPLVYNDNAAAKQALDAQQIDAIVADLPTALFITAVEIEGSTVFGQFPAVEGSEGEPWGLLLAKDSPLVECVDLALGALTETGTLEAITTEWMSQSTDVPEISLE